MKVKDFIEEYYYPRSCAYLAESTVKGYTSTINKYIIPSFGD